ncbi:putative extracellular receptor [Leishmania major strain Friedlin]|uniref:Putative extracellular receptor n=1 Tax=Leishmania major TaxID=5664 RepID=Q4QDF7_LEIMA|nr:putative extracellular receptor [Leishmania major strain Friedlin]CAG9572751.1 extracellular_receptor_-_putative [Leishmania major strain Friedlin]CAJ07149.1 putative extracellular receptor [Leishmania major strain Friedlin]|eukprot:XP_001682641.1 putative extracellular receptor [Leishmania major strain Friedlin]
MTEASLSEAITAFLTNTSATHQYLITLFRPAPIILDTGGNLLTALTQITVLLSNPLTFPSVLFLAETADVSASVVDMLRQNDTTSEILIISAHSSNTRLCDPKTNRRTMCMVPRDMINVRGLLEVVSNQLSWYSMSLALSNDNYGDGVAQAITSEVQTASTTATIVAHAFMNGAASTTDDDAVVASLIKYRARGVGCFLREAETRRLHAAVERNRRAANSVFLIASRESLNVLPDLTGDMNGTAKPWGAIFVSAYTPPAELVSQGFFPTTHGTAVDEYGAFVLSHLLDGLLMLDAAKGAIDNMSALRAVRFRGYTGNVAFDPIYYQRVETVFSLITASHTMRNPLVTWTLKDYSSDAAQVNANPNVTSALIKTSPLRTATICMASPSNCAFTQMMMSMLFVITAHNENVADNDSDSVFNFYPVAVNTGASGVMGLSSLIPIARSCTVLTGPGSDAVVMAVTPVVNEFHIPQLDYAVSNDYFTDNVHTYPYFSRSLPKNTFADVAVTQLCVHYGWERVIIITSNDQFGISRAQSMATRMQQQNLYVEATYYLSDGNNATVADCMEKIYAKLVSRIIILINPFTATQAETFFRLSDYLTYMRQYIFFMDSALCHAAAASANGDALRQKLPSSICIYPNVTQTRLAALNTLYTNSDYATTRQEMRKLMSDGGFLSSVESCDISSISPYAGFAVDAGYVLIDSISRAVAENVSLNVAAHLLPYIRSTSIDDFTGECTIDSTGNRLYAAYSINIQLLNGSALFIGTWNSKASPALEITEWSFVWLTNSTAVPLDTFRDASFVLSTAFSASPGAIVISVLGFILTIAVFYFCYRHYRMQKLIEQALEANQFPVTDEELRSLRGIKDDV